MMILSLVRDYHNQHAIVKAGGWNIADAVQRSYDVEGMHIGTVAGTYWFRCIKKNETI